MTRVDRAPRQGNANLELRSSRCYRPEAHPARRRSLRPLACAGQSSCPCAGQPGLGGPAAGFGWACACEVCASLCWHARLAAGAGGAPRQAAGVCVRGLLLSVLELLLWALPCIVVLAVLLFTECTFVSSFLCSFAFDLLLKK